MINDNKEIAIMSLEKLPSEILINIFSNLDERDLFILQLLSKKFYDIINDEELWKNLFLSKFKTSYFPSYANSNKFSVEFNSRKDGLNEWKHNKSVRTKYSISSGSLVTSEIEQLLFDYPRCLCYSDGVITLLQLQQFRKTRGNKTRLTYIPCTTPQGCSTMHFDLGCAVFGRFDGRIYGKMLSTKSYLQPIVEFDDHHTGAVTAIKTVDNNENRCISGSENGDIIWWTEAKKVKSMKLSNKPILRVEMWKDWTIVLDEEKIYVIYRMTDLNEISLDLDIKNINSRAPVKVHFFKVDFGSKSVLVGDTKNLYIISFNPNNNLFGFTKSMNFEDELIEEVVIDEASAKRDQRLELAGQDGCFIAIKTDLNKIYIVDIRAPGATFHLQSKIVLSNGEKAYTCQITNLVMVCALKGYVNIYDALSGELIKTVQKTEKEPGFLRISQGRLLLSNRENMVHYFKFIPDDNSETSKSGTGQSSSANRNTTKWKETLNAELELYEEEEERNELQRMENSRLLNTYGGDFTTSTDLNGIEDEEELQLRIALMESENYTSNAVNAENDEAMRNAIQESDRLFNTEQNSTLDNQIGIDEELRMALEQSRIEDELRRATEVENITSSVNNINSSSSLEDEELQLAIALSLSEAERN
ncbi:hypothetical protein Kpol_309p6 [Vanderwaltozyma polyspora DSM 70294]|uniref:F-box domain-containing protein n=1 Tax=Vanderwaltozyma polyspora (strain ATCC 22028 / DSM 70294 / BCRC 21397 / CBS 2163 / NBRC 10782 / NRRL Y-8283 / UCD 57-17) TaxID=436907 RepID=A7TSX1_VANPO|nr:uncharacterized protein Kpol_309p6 [Vanderwaltozyma polyspora DSM 70294]EDO14637.1 hypothetical protein Kpol_309p6 [Vanderwaltozyma polyspora DSM 70294]